jgi:hypothetical protein
MELKPRRKRGCATLNLIPEDFAAQLYVASKGKRALPDRSSCISVCRHSIGELRRGQVGFLYQYSFKLIREAFLLEWVAAQSGQT